MSSDNSDIDKKDEAAAPETEPDSAAEAAPAAEPDATPDVANATETAASTSGEAEQPVENLAEGVAFEIALLAELAKDTTPAPPEPTESFTHPVTGREVYVPKNSRALGPSALVFTMSLLMFVGGSLATLMMTARAFELHGTVLLVFVIASCAAVLGLAGGWLLKALGDGERAWIGAGLGACFGAITALLIYARTSHHSWWQ